MDVELRQCEREGDEAGVLARRIRIGVLKKHNVRMAARLGHKPSGRIVEEPGNILMFAQTATNSAKIYAAADLLDQQMPKWELNNLSDEHWLRMTGACFQDDVIRQCQVFYCDGEEFYSVEYGELRSSRMAQTRFLHELRNLLYKKHKYSAFPEVKKFLYEILDEESITTHTQSAIIPPNVWDLYASISHKRKIRSDFLVHIFSDSIEHDPFKVTLHSLDRTIKWLLK